MKIGVDIGGMSAKIGLVNDENQIVDRIVVKTDCDVAAALMVKKITDGIKELMNTHKLTTEEIDGIGLGCPGTIGNGDGSIIYSCNLNWNNVPLVELIRSEIDTKVEVANDADVAALGEVCAGAAKGHNSAVLVTLGTGVGGGVIINKKIFSGVVTGGCEIGHMVIRQGGAQCSCGRQGCFEAYSSSSALMRMAREAADENHDSLLYKMCDGQLENMNGIIPFRAAEQGDETAQMVVEVFEDYLACGLANIVNIFRPEMLILGGGVSAERENLTVPVQKKMNAICYGGDRNQIAKIVVSALGNDAGIIGAANLV